MVHFGVELPFEKFNQKSNTIQENLRRNDAFSTGSQQTAQIINVADLLLDLVTSVVPRLHLNGVECSQNEQSNQFLKEHLVYGTHVQKTVLWIMAF